uniref:Putative secreted protein n=1 Tax=Anopheles darlingi TaxID=43151 RepID=A0A2M4DAV5_ANODA
MPSISQKLAACIFLVTASSYGVDALAGRSITVVACQRFWLKMLFAASLCKTIIKDRCSDRTRNGYYARLRHYHRNRKMGNHSVGRKMHNKQDKRTSPQPNNVSLIGDRASDRSIEYRLTFHLIAPKLD